MPDVDEVRPVRAHTEDCLAAQRRRNGTLLWCPCPVAAVVEGEQ